MVFARGNCVKSGIERNRMLIAGIYRLGERPESEGE